MIRRFIPIAIIAAFSAPVFAESGVALNRIDNVANVHGRAGVPVTRAAGLVAYAQTDVNIAGRNPAPIRAGKTVISNVRELDHGFGRS
jgi:hypothetical protein